MTLGPVSGRAGTRSAVISSNIQLFPDNNLGSHSVPACERLAALAVDSQLPDPDRLDEAGASAQRRLDVPGQF